MGEEMEEMIKEIFGIVDSMMPTIARMIRRLYDELVKVGFTPEQAMSIVTHYSSNLAMSGK